MGAEREDFLEMAVLLQKQLVEQEKSKLDKLKTQAKGNSIQREIMRKAVDLRGAGPGQAMIGNQPVPVEQGAEQLPFLDQATRPRV